MIMKSGLVGGGHRVELGQVGAHMATGWLRGAFEVTLALQEPWPYLHTRFLIP